MLPAGVRPGEGAGWPGPVSVGVLGPLVVAVGGRPVRLTAGRLRTLVAVLAMSAGQAVPAPRLAAAIWDEGLPVDARRAVQTYVARLRGLLGPGVISSGPAGYVLRAGPGQVDALRFLQLTAAAAAAGAGGERELLGQAIGLWRGAPFEEVASRWLENTEAPRLVEAYLAAVERRTDLDLAAGRHAELVAPLRELAGRYPLREPLWARLLVALHRAGRPAEALETYQAIRVLLADELGTDPGPGLQTIHADLLAGRPPHPTHTTAATTTQPPPRQLPTTGRFTGRNATLAAVAEMFGDASGPAPRQTVICSITGMAGAGKTALAVHAAQQLAERFPDGQLYVNLHGATPGLQPLQPLEVLGRFLRALGTDPAAVPTGLEEASVAFRSRMAGRRLLMVLDNAADAAQVAPLLPGSPGCGVLVTSRRLISTLEGATHLHLNVLDPAEAAELLGRLAGQQRVAAEPEAVAEVARYCGYLPLALRIAGARLAARPSWPVRALAGRLAGQERRLDELEVAEARVRASFTISLQQLQASDDPLDWAAAQAFELLGLLDGPELSTPVVARLLDMPEVRTEEALERLVDAQLLHALSPGRYQLHDLLRLYARELACQQHGARDRAAALARALGFYVATAWRTLELLRPGDYQLARAGDRWRKGGLEFTDEREALAWLEAERANLLAAVQQAAVVPGVPAQAAVQLAQALFGFFWVRSHWDDWVEVNQTALQVARRMGDLAGQAKACNDIGGGYLRQGRYEQAEACLRESLAIRRELGDGRGESACLANLGVVHEWQGRYEEALACQQESLAIERELGDRRGQAESLGNVGTVYLRLGRYQEALGCLRKSLAINRELCDRRGEAITLANLGRVHLRLGRYQEALACLRKSLAIDRELGDRDGEANCLNDLGVVHRLQGLCEESQASLRESLTIRRELGDRSGQAESLRELGETVLALGCSDEARAHWREALAIYEQLRTPEAGQVRDLLAGLPPSPPR